MKGQVAIEELVSLAAYISILSLLVAAVLGLRGAGEEWGRGIYLKAEADSLARAEDAFHNSNIYNPYSWPGGGEGYLKLEAGEGEATAPVLAGSVEVAKGEPA